PRPLEIPAAIRDEPPAPDPAARAARHHHRPERQDPGGESDRLHRVAAPGGRRFAPGHAAAHRADRQARQPRRRALADPIPADAVRFVEVSALGHVVREGGTASRLPPVPGRAVHTTIDLELQRYIAQIFPAGQRGAVLALNPNTGEILALYSAPGFDPNAFVGGVDPDYWRRLNVSEAHPLFDRTIQARYPPGSTWKLALAAMALRHGVVTLRSRMPIPCR